MASSADQGKKDKVEKSAMASAAAAKTGVKKKMKKVVMLQKEIDSHMRYRTIVIPENHIPKVSKERLAARKNPADQGNLPVPMDQMDDYLRKIIRSINRNESKYTKRRENILNQYYTKGYVEQDVTDGEEETETSPAGADGEETLHAGDQETIPAGDEGFSAPHPGRRRFRPGVSINAGKINKLN